MAEEMLEKGGMMDITKARRVVELEKGGRKILVALWENGKISSCVEEVGARVQRCEACEGNEELCNDYIEHLKEQGYQAAEVLVSEIGAEESLPRFLEEKEAQAQVEPISESSPESVEPEEGESA